MIVTPVEGADMSTALATIERQVYEGVRELVIVGDRTELPEEAGSAMSLEEAIAGASPDIDYLWMVHADARPRPDALAALVSEVDRSEASLGGSKILIAGTRDELESIGSATDVFGDAYSGLDEGEIDLQQYDVVREVAAVSSVSMLVRRDLAQGLRGLDPLMEPVAAGLDFSQRARLAGGRVITVPSSEVYHQARCIERGRGWREQAGRLRAMLKAYRPITLAWVVPFYLLVTLVDSLANLLLLRWRPAARNVLAWLWNLWHLPSTISSRRRFRSVRAFGDEELFRFQARGSVRLREIGSEVTNRVLSAFDDDQALAKGSRRVWSSPGIWGALIAVLIIFFSARTLFFSGVPNIGFSFPFESPTIAADRFFAGWNDSGLGSPDAVHPVAGFSALAGLLAFGSEGTARTLVTILFGFIGVVGMGRLAGRLGFRGPSRYLSGLVLLAGPGTAALVGSGSWTALGGAALLPWAVRSVFLHPTDRERSRLTHIGWTLFWSILLAAISPLLGLVPPLVALVWALFGGSRSSILLAIVSLLGLVAAIGFLHDDMGWLTDPSRRLGVVVPIWWVVTIAATAVSLVLVDTRARRLGGVGGALALGGLAMVRFGVGGPGVEEATLIVASIGSALVVAAGLDRLSL
ncbi:MAG: glycosyltransferase, partial [Acidimicrobiia bacterium]